MDRTIDNRECPLYGSRYCELLHMRTCAQCPLMRPNYGITPETLRADLDLYETLLPEGGIAQLFEARTCRLCRDEASAGRRQGYAIFNMAHPEPERMERGLIFGKRRAAAGTMVPVQLAVCQRCRRRLLLLDYLPVLLPTAVGALLLWLLAGSQASGALSRAAAYLPFVLWAGGVALAYGAGKLACRALRRRFGQDMYVNVLEQPTVAGMRARGWFPVPARDGVKLVFSKSRLCSGLGTAPDGAEAPAAAQAEGIDNHAGC